MKTDPAADLRKAIILSEEMNVLSLLEEVVLKKNSPAKLIAGLHDALLFAIAFAPSASVRTAAEKKLNEIGVIVKLRENDFQDTGMSGSVVISSFTFSLVEWMTEKYPKKIIFHSFDKAEEDIGESLKLILPGAEAEILSNGWNKNKLFKELCAGKISVEKIIGLFSACTNLKLRDLVFSQLGLYVSVHFSNEMISRSNARSIPYPDFFHTEIVKKAEAEKIISSRLSKQRKISEQEQEQLVFNSRMQLAAMGRETDPVTFAAIEETEFIVLDRGFSIALFSLLPENRLAFDSYIGYMMFKNGLPIAYGGAWIFFNRALIGINIFDAYRGGESSFLFAQLLRVYHQRFKVNSFSVEPYQYGKDNPEGISSGAYWFYYRFGFRSDDEKLKVLAEEESEKIKTIKGYRSPANVLKQFTNSNITLLLKDKNDGQDAGKISLEISKHIALHFNGNRFAALAAAKKNFEVVFGKKAFQPKTKNEISVFENWSLLLLAHSKKINNKKAASLLPALLKSKAGGKESDYISFLQKLK